MALTKLCREGAIFLFSYCLKFTTTSLGETFSVSLMQEIFQLVSYKSTFLTDYCYKNQVEEELEREGNHIITNREVHLVSTTEKGD